MEIISGIERHRRRRLEEKLRIVAEAEAHGAEFALVADPQETPPPARAAQFGTSRIEIVLPDGTCVRVDNQVGPQRCAR